jgi:RNA polymerase sigma-70 factor (sigma-E family)
MNRAEREASYVEFVTGRRDHFRRIAYALCGDWHRADDLLQQALVKLYVAWPRVRRDGGEEAYLRRILVRANIDESRRPWRREHATETLPDRAIPAAPGFEDRSELTAALQQLPPMQRKTVLLRHWLDLSVREAAAELGISEGTVKSNTARGLAALESLLARERS